jgi:acyl-CoA thioesterase
MKPPVVRALEKGRSRVSMIEREKDPVGYAREVVGRSPFAGLLGIEVEEARDSYARASIKITEEHCNAEARAHGGVLSALADQAFGVAAHASGYRGYTIELKINFFRAAVPGDVVIAEATPIDTRKRVSLWNIELRTDTGEKIGAAQGLGYHLG